MNERYTRNVKAPYQRVYLMLDALATRDLTMAERGVLYTVRAELWSVEGAKMFPADLVKRLRLGKRDRTALGRLFESDLLRLDDEGCAYDEQQQRELATISKRSAQSSSASKARWDSTERAKKSPESLPDKALTESTQEDPRDF
jgi:hypothetical protein